MGTMFRLNNDSIQPAAGTKLIKSSELGQLLVLQCHGLGATQFDAGFHFFFHKIFVVSLPVPGHDFYAFLFQIAHLLA